MTAEQYVLARASELQPDLALPEGKNVKARKAALKRVVANMTINNQEMLSLFPEIISSMRSPDPEIKRMCFLYLETYAKARPQQAADALDQLSKEVANKNSSPKVKALALRALSSVPMKIYAKRTLALIPEALRSDDVYLRKTACWAVAKAWTYDRVEAEASNILTQLNRVLVRERSPVVVAAAVEALVNITDRSPEMQFVIDFPTSMRIASMLPDCPEFAQISIISALTQFVPQTAEDAQRLADLVIPSLRHTNAAVTMNTTRLLLMLSHYSEKLSESVPSIIFGPLLSQLNRAPEIQYSVLRNIQLLLQTLDSDSLQKVRIPPQTFFCKVSDVSYMKTTKIDILAVLCTPKNIDMVLKEIFEFTQLKYDDAAKRRAIAAIGKVGVKFESAVPECVKMLRRVINEPEAIVSLTSLVRRYPANSELHDAALNTLRKLEICQEDSARVAYIWLLGRFPENPTHSVKVLNQLLEGFAKEPLIIQRAILTASVRMFLAFAEESKTIIPRTLELAANTVADPDLRDRALMYWRLLSLDPSRAASIVSSPAPPIAEEDAPYDYSELEDLELSLGYLSSIYLKPADQLFRMEHQKQLKSSPALLPRKLNKLQKVAPKRRDEQQESSSPFSPNPSRPEPPESRRNLVRSTSLVDQFEELQMQPTPPGDQSERLIDI